MNSKFIFITGGVLSSLGKGITSASIGLLLEGKGLKVAMMKLDPYLNVDPGTMNPFEHGEVYVTSDGAETDLDLGHYYRFTDSPLSRLSSTSAGQIYEQVIKQERRGDYLGKTVQIIPHITDEIKSRIACAATQEKDIDIVLVEVGGTVGDIESLPFLEAIRQFRNDYPKRCLNLHLTYIPYIDYAKEVKTKPTQHSVQQLQRNGIFPDMILCRSKFPLDDDIKAKISLFCSVPKKAVIDVVDVANSVYEVPLQLEQSGVDQTISELLDLPKKKTRLKEWKEMLETFLAPEHEVCIGIVGKYLQHQDAYKSVVEALLHGGIAHKSRVTLKRIDSDKIESEKQFAEEVQGCHGILVPGGFGERGWMGKIFAAKYARENNLPYFGICLGMQVMTVEFARNVLQLKGAHSTEVDPSTPTGIISLLSEQRNVKLLGGTMRLGTYPCRLEKDSLAYKAYKQIEIAERHRHRYEFNNEYLDLCASKGLRVTGHYAKGNLCEILENSNHPWMVGVQFHPEFQSKPTQPHPLFQDFIGAALTYSKACSPSHIQTKTDTHTSEHTHKWAELSVSTTE